MIIAFWNASENQAERTGGANPKKQKPRHHLPPDQKIDILGP